ncbi:MAG TPA: spherulation-specific family 4 protein [Pirellulales bacterium]|nr:spherulation-specific family 4 protein [Pirellulales bacterium]
MRREIYAFCLLVMPPAALCGDVLAQTKPDEVKLFVPAYFYPAGEGLKEWDKLIAAAKEVPIVAIANPATGPGERLDPNYVEVISRASKAGVKVIGYVSTEYAKRSIEQVKADIDRWCQFYPAVEGIFFDEQTGDASRLERYRAAFDYARRKIKGAFVASNPGVPCDAAYFAGSCPDAICVFEHHEGYDRFAPAAGWGDAERRRSAALPYDTRDAQQMSERLRRAVDLHLGYFYATDDNGVNPWDRLPTYWDNEVAAVREVNGVRRK